MSPCPPPDAAPESPSSEHVERQRRFYDSRSHRNLQPRGDDRYVTKLASRLVERLGIGPEARVLEIGSGFGRFTFALLEHCASVTALDLSERSLAALARERDARGIDASRCRTVQGDLDRVEPGAVGGVHDFVVGFFVLHHLEDVSRSLARVVPLASDRGGLAFLEPNRWNPLYALQVACCPDMTFREERGVWTLDEHAILADLSAHGLAVAPVHRFGFFPPQLLNRSSAVRRLEARLERQRWLSRVLPFQLLVARGAAGAPP